MPRNPNYTPPPANTPNVPFAGRSRVGQMVQTWQAFKKAAAATPTTGTTVVQPVNPPVSVVGIAPITVSQNGAQYTVSVADSAPLWTRITLAAPSPIPSPSVGQAYLLVGDFSAIGSFDDEDCITTLTSTAIGVSIKREESQCLPGQQSWTMQILAAYEGSAGYGSEAFFNAPSVKNTGWTGDISNLVPTTWTVSQII